ncbi:hypothetical protein LCGC14_1647400 [marine sediment metagenome]|uniref:Uncharacterized protein n=1 Tax=marine sediment metagenome TaxID=412755 RepID=A0A0F9IKC5_9ZZZZ
MSQGDLDDYRCAGDLSRGNFVFRSRMEQFMSLAKINIFSPKFHPEFPSGLGYLYSIVLNHGAKIKRVKKKWFRQHYTIHVDNIDSCRDGEFVFHLTPQDSWWEWVW